MDILITIHFSETRFADKIRCKKVLVWPKAGPFYASSFTYRVILSVLDPRKCEYLKDLDFERAYMTTYLVS